MPNDIPNSFLDIASIFDIAAGTTDTFERVQPQAKTNVTQACTDTDTDIYLDDITQFYPPDLPNDAENPGGVPTVDSEWGRVILHFETGEIVLINGFTATVGTAGIAHVEQMSPDTGRGLINTTATAHAVGERVWSFVSSISHTEIVKAIGGIQSKVIAAFDYSTGHDHSGAGLGSPIPSAGIQAGAITTTKIANSAVTYSKMEIAGTKADTFFPSYDLATDKLVWTDPAGNISEAAQDAVGGILTDTDTVDFTYNDGAPSITADVKTNSINETHIDFGSGANQVDGQSIPTARIGASTFYTVQHLQDIFHSAGFVSGGTVTDNLNGTVDVSAGTGLIRATTNALDVLMFFDWPASASLALTDRQNNWVYVDYNGGTPIVAVSTTKPTDTHTKVLLSSIYRDGTLLHITDYWRPQVGDHAALMIQRLQEIAPFARVSGGVIGETGTRNISITAGTWWHGLFKYTTDAFDSSVADTFSYYYRDGLGGFTEVTGQTQINNNNYDDGDGTLGILTANRYGVHWVYLETDSSVAVVYGRGDYTVTQAEDATPPSTIPDELVYHSRLIGKIIIQKSSSTFYSVESVFDNTFSTSGVSDHSVLSNLNAGTYLDGGHTYLVPVHSEAADPDINDDIDNYKVGTIWVNTSDNGTFICADNTNGAAVWNELYGSWTLNADVVSGVGGQAITSGETLNVYGQYGLDTEFDTAAGNLTINGPATKNIVLSAAGGWPSTTTGSSATTQIEHSGNGIDLVVTDFDQSTEEYFQWTIVMPDDWDQDTILAKFIWTSRTATGGNVIWGIEGRAYVDNDAIDQAWGTGQEITDSWIANEDIHITAETGGITIAETSPDSGELVQIRVYRKAASVSDTLDADARLIAVKLTYGVAP